MDGQEPVLVFGRVTRGEGGPAPGAALTLCDLSGDQLDRAAADEGGHYQLVPPTGGTYLVICSSPIHHPHASLVAVADRPLRHDVGLAGGGATLGGTVGMRHGGGTNGHDADALAGQGDVVLTLTDVRGTVVAVTRSGADVSSAGAGRPVPEALATLVSEDGDVVGSRVTGEDGSFRFDDVPHGVYTITASGYAPVACEIEIGPGHPSQVVLDLVPPAVDGQDGDGPVGGGHAGSNGTGRYVDHHGTPGVTESDDRR